MEIQKTSNGGFIIICSDDEAKVLLGCVAATGVYECEEAFKQILKGIKYPTNTAEIIYEYNVYAPLREAFKKKRGRPKKNGNRD